MSPLLKLFFGPPITANNNLSHKICCENIIVKHFSRHIDNAFSLQIEGLEIIILFIWEPWTVAYKLSQPVHIDINILIYPITDKRW